MTNIQKYVKDNFEALPKSTFDDETVVIVEEFHNSNEGWGHHSYSGVGIGSDGEVYYCFSSGCSCSGSCGAEHRMDTKALQSDEGSFNLEALKPEAVDYNALSIDFSSY